MNEQAPQVALSHITKQIGHHKVLDDISLEIHSSTVHGLIGPNGAGKTSLMRVILGTLVPDSGSIVRRSSPRNIGAVTEILGLDKSMTPKDAQKYYSRVLSLPPETIQKRYAESGVTEFLDTRVAKMSTGMRRRLEIALALADDPPLLLFDEPLNGLDPDGISWVHDLIKRCRQRGKAILVSSHILSGIAEISDTVTVMDSGRIAHTGPTPTDEDLMDLYEKHVNGETENALS